MSRLKRPNILLIIADSMGKQLLGEAGAGLIATPNIDALAREGISFSRAYTVCPLCTPARAGLFTGQVPSAAGPWGNDLALYATTRTIGQYFEAGGYRSAYIGKWHLDGTDYFGTGLCPEGYLEDYWFDGRNYLQSLSPAERRRWRRGMSPEEIRRARIAREDTWAGQVTDRACAFLDEANDTPFLLIASYDEPHGPSLCPPPYCDQYAGFVYPFPENFSDGLSEKPLHQRLWAQSCYYLREDCRPGEGICSPLYFGSASFVDSEIGRLLAALERRDPENTLVLFTADHGHYLGAHKLDGKGPALYEEVCNVPLIARYPAGGLRGRREERLISHLDLLPSLLALADIEAPEILQGRDQSFLFTGGPGEAAQAVFLEFNRYGNSHDSWFGFFPIRCIVTDRFKLVVNLFTGSELYDLRADPGELINLIDRPAMRPTAEALLRGLLAHMDAVRDPMRGPVWMLEGLRADGIRWERGQRRLRERDGFLPPACDYDTGLPAGETGAGRD